MVTFLYLERFLGGGVPKKKLNLYEISFQTQEQIMMTVWYFQRFRGRGYQKERHDNLHTQGI